MNYPPRPIADESELAGFEARIWDLLAIAERTPAQDAYLTVLTTLVERWENEHVVIPSLAGVELVKALLEDTGRRHKDLVPIFGTESIVSEVLSGKRALQAKHIAG